MHWTWDLIRMVVVVMLCLLGVGALVEKHFVRGVVFELIAALAFWYVLRHAYPKGR